MGDAGAKSADSSSVMDKLTNGADVELLERMRPLELFFIGLCSQKMKKKIEGLEMAAEYLEFHLKSNDLIMLRLSMDGKTLDITYMFYKTVPQENWVMNEDPMKTDKFTWTSNKTKTVWSPEELTFDGETFEINNGEADDNKIWILQKEGCLKKVSDYLVDLFHPKAINLHLVIEEFPNWMKCCVWKHGQNLKMMIISCGEDPLMLRHDEFRFLLRQGSVDKMLSLCMVYPEPRFVLQGVLPLKLLSYSGPVPWVRLDNLMTPNLELVSLCGCRFAAEELRTIISTFIDGFWPNLKYFHFVLPEGASKKKLEKRVLRGWKNLPPDENRRSRYFGRENELDCQDFMDIESKDGLLASIGVDNGKFVMVVWHERFPSEKQEEEEEEQVTED